MTRHGARATVLVVDDDADIGALVADCLETDGFRTVLVRNGRQALDALPSARPDVVVLDMMMPELDGFGFLQRFVQLPAPRPPVLAMSAFDGYLGEAKSAGAQAILAKPFTIDALVGAVEALLAGREPEERRMLAPPLAERDRLLAVLSLQLEEAAPTAALDAFVDRVAAMFRVPICLVSIVTEDRQYWHSFCGLPPDLEAARGTPRSESFCTHAVVAHAALVVQDARENPLFAGNPLVVGRGLRFYAGVPLTSRFGQALGTLCLLDFRARTFSSFDLELLGVLARRVVAEIEWREKRHAPSAPQAAFRYLSWVDEELDLLGREAFVQALQVSSLRAGERRTDLALAVVAVAPDRLHAVTGALKVAFPRGLLGRLGFARIGVLADEERADAVLERARGAAGTESAIEVVQVPRIAGGAEQFLSMAESAIGRAGLAPRV